MRWVAARIVVLLLVGAAISVASAWACALWSRVRWVVEDNVYLASNAYPVDRPLGWPTPRYRALASGFGVRGVDVQGGAGGMVIVDKPTAGTVDFWGLESNDATCRACRLRFGWPWVTMQVAACNPPVRWASDGVRFINDGAVAPWRPLEGIVLPEKADRWLAGPGRRLPTQPYWPGLWAATIVNAGMLGLAAVTHRAIARRMCQRRGRCVHCRYGMGSLPVCPECGRPNEAAGAAR